MVASTSRKRRSVSSYSLDLLSVTNNIIANVAGVVAENVALSQHRGLQRGTKKLGSLPGRTILERNRRSVKDIYKQLGKVYFRRAYYRMKYSTFVRLASVLRPYIIAASGKKGTTRHQKVGFGKYVMICWTF